MANAEELIINLKAIMDVSDVKSNVNQIQGVLNKLKLPENLGKNLSQNIAKVGTETDKVTQLMNNGFKKAGDVNSLDSSLKAIDAAYKEILSDLGKIDGISIQNALSFDSGPITDLQKKWDELKASFDQKIQTSGLKEVEQQVSDINTVSKSKQFSVFLEQFKAGNIEGATTALENLALNMKSFGSEGFKNSESFKTFSQNVDQLTTSIAKGDFSTAATQIEKLVTSTNSLKDGDAKINTYAQAIQNLLSHLQSLSSGDTGLDEVKKDMEEVGSSLASLKSNALNEVVDSLQNASTNAETASAQIQNMGQELLNTATAQSSLNTQVSQLTSRLTYFTSLVNGVQLFKRAIKEAYEEVKTLDAAMTETAVVTEFSVGDMWDKLPEYTDVAQKYGASIQDAYEVMTIFYQQGLETNQVFEIGEQTMQMARIAGLDYADAADKMTNALRGFNMELNETSSQRVNDVYSELAKISASDTKELSTAMTKVASLANSANMEFENTAAFLAQMIETTRESAETAGTALKTVVARFAEVKKLYSQGELTGATEDGEEINVNNVSTALRAAGIDLNEFMTGAKGLDEILFELSAKWDTLDLTTQRYIATMAAGSRQQSRFLALMSDNERLTELASAAYDSEGSSAEQFAKTQDSLQTKLENLKTAWDEFIMGLANAGMFKKIIDILTTLMGWINKILSGFDKLGAVGSFGRSVTSLGLVVAAFMALKKGIDATIVRTAKLIGVFQGAGAAGIKAAVAPTAAFAGLRKGILGVTATINGMTASVNRLNVGSAFERLKNGFSSLPAAFEGLKTALYAPFKEIDVAAEGAISGMYARFAGFADVTGKALPGVTGLEKAFVNLDGTVGGSIRVFEKEGQQLIQFKNLNGELIDITTGYTAIQKLANGETLNAQQIKTAAIAISQAYGLSEADATLAEKALTTQLEQEDIELIKNAQLKELIAKNNGQLSANDLFNQFKSSEGLFGNFSKNAKKSFNVYKQGAEAAAENTEALGTGMGGLVGKIGGLIVANGTLIASLAAVAAIAAITAAVIYNIWKNSEKQVKAQALEDTKEKTEQLADELEKASSQVEDLKSAWDELSGAEETLDGLIEGTESWKAALLEVNNTVLDLIAEYPELAKYMSVDSEMGKLSISEAGYSQLLDSKLQYQNDLAMAQASSAATETYLESTIEADNDLYEAFNISSFGDAGEALEELQDDYYFGYKTNVDNENTRKSAKKVEFETMAGDSGFVEKYSDKVAAYQKWLTATESAEQTLQSTLKSSYGQQLSSYSSAAINAATKASAKDFTAGNQYETVYKKVTSGKTNYNSTLMRSGNEDIQNVMKSTDSEHKSHEARKADVEAFADASGDAWKWSDSGNKLTGPDGTEYTVKFRGKADADKGEITEDEAIQKMTNSMWGGALSDTLTSTAEMFDERWDKLEKNSEKGQVTVGQLIDDYGKIITDETEGYTSEVIKAFQEQYKEEIQNRLDALNEGYTLNTKDDGTIEVLDANEEAVTEDWSEIEDYYQAFTDVQNEALASSFKGLIDSYNETADETDKITRTQQTEIMEAFSGIGESAIEGYSKLKNIAENTTDDSIKTLAEGAMGTDQFGAEAQFDEFMESTYNTEDFQDELEKVRVDGEITAASLAQLSTEFSDLDTMFGNGEVSCGAMAAVLRQVEAGTLDLADANDALLTSLTKLEEVESSIASAMQRLSDDNIGESQTDAVSKQGNTFYNSAKAIADRGAYGDEQLDDYMIGLLGQEKWESYATDSEGNTRNRQEQYEAAMEDSGYSGSYESIYMNQMASLDSKTSFFDVSSGGFSFDFSQLEAGATVAEYFQNTLGLSKEQAENLEAYCALMSPDFKAAANEANKLAANINFLERSTVSITDANKENQKYLIASEKSLKAMAAEQGYDKDNDGKINDDELEEYKKTLEDMYDLAADQSLDDILIDPNDLSKNKTAIDKWSKSIKEAAQEANGMANPETLLSDFSEADFEIEGMDDLFAGTFESLGSQIQYYLEQGVSAANIATLIEDQLGDMNTEGMKDKLIAAANEAYGPDSAAASIITAGYVDGVWDTEAFVTAYEEAMAQNNASELAQSINTCLSDISGTIAIQATTSNKFTEWLLGGEDGVIFTIKGDVKVHDPGTIDVPDMSTLLNTGDYEYSGPGNSGDATVTDDKEANEDDDDGGSDNTSNTEDSGTKAEQDLVNLERERNKLEKEFQELQEGGVWTSAAQIANLKKQRELLYDEQKIQEQILKDKQEKAAKLENALGEDKVSLYLTKNEDGSYSYTTLADQLLKANRESDQELIEDLKELVDQGNEVADQQVEVDDFDYKLDENSDAIFEVYGNVIDETVDGINNGIDTIGDLASSAISLFETLASTAVDAFNSYLSWLTIKIDDEHDIGQLDSSLSNRIDLLNWEYEKILKRQIAYDGMDSLNEKEIFENSNQTAKNIIARMQNQRRLYENSFRQLEDLGLNINAELTEAFEKLYDQLYGANGPFTRLNNQVNNFKGKLEDVLPSTSTLFGEVKGVIGNLFNKAEDKIGDVIDNLFPNSIVDDIIDSFTIDDYKLGDFGKSNMQKIIQLFTELTPSFNADYQIANKAELVDALNQKLGTILTNDTITSKFIQGYLDYLSEVESQMESEVENLRSSESEILNMYDTLTEILNRGKEEYSSLSQALYSAIVDSKNRLIEELTALNDSITDSDSEIIETLKNNLDLIRQERDNDDTEQDLRAKEAKLAYLRQDTSGANLQEILKLEKELEDDQESYTDTLIDQKITELENQNQEAADQRQVQIDLLQAEVDNTKGIWDAVEELIAGIAKFDHYLTGEIDRDGYNAVIATLKKGQSYIDSSEFDKTSSEEEWNSQIRAASLYKQVRDNLSEEYNYLKLAANLVDEKTGLPEEFAANSGWHNYVDFSSLEQTIDRTDETLKNAVTAINNLVEKITISYDDEQSLHMKTTYYGGLIQAVSGAESAATKAIEDLASGAPGVLTQLTTGMGNIAKGILKGTGESWDNVEALLANGSSLLSVLGTGANIGGQNITAGNLGEAIGYLVEGMTNFAAAAADAASMGMDMMGDMAPGIADIGVAVATALKETFFNDYERVNNEIEENIESIIDTIGNAKGTTGYLKEIRDNIQLAKTTGMGKPDGDSYPIYEVLTESYQEIISDYRNLLAKDTERTDIEGFNKLYNRIIKMREVLGGYANYDVDADYQDDLEIDTAKALEAIQSWHGEIGSLFNQIDKSIKGEVTTLVNGILSADGKTMGNKEASRWIDIYDAVLMLNTSSNTIKRLATAMEEYEPKLAEKLYSYFDKVYEQENTPQESFVSFWNHKLTGIWGDVSDFFSGFWEKISSFFDDAAEEVTGHTTSAITGAWNKLTNIFTNGETDQSDSIFVKIWNSIKEAWNTFTGWLKEIWEKIKSFANDGFFSKLITWVNNALSNLFQDSIISKLFKSDRATKWTWNTTNTGSYATGGKISSNQTALVGEAGTELIQHARGGATLATGPSMANLQKGDIVYNASQTKQILKGSNLDFGRFAEGTATAMMTRNVLGATAPTFSFSLPDISENNKENNFNLNLNLEDLTVDSIDRVEEVADRVMNKINDAVSGAMWPYNRL